ncbi:SRPBCC family protein [Actinoplanes sp. NPDC026619]|uniref:SRPBCC family protein n=1 Tax=Actinoplanes sp. NPDC026619 TaxID=3155798 RepID=UPI0033DB7C08
MTSFDPGPPGDATLTKADDGWTLIFIRQLDQPPEQVWTALTEPAELDRWAPFAAVAPLTAPGPTTLTMVDGDVRMDLPATVTVVDPPAVLEYTWGDDVLRWELTPAGGGTRLTLRHTLASAPGEPGLEAKVAAGWHLCLEVLNRLLNSDPVGVIRGRDAMNFGWEELRAAYAERL